MSEPTNADRAAWADESIKLFAKNTGLDRSGDDDETAFKDLLADMRHWCDERDIDFDLHAENSKDVYKEELAEEEAQKAGEKKLDKRFYDVIVVDHRELQVRISPVLLAPSWDNDSLNLDGEEKFREHMSDCGHEEDTIDEIVRQAKAGKEGQWVDINI